MKASPRAHQCWFVLGALGLASILLVPALVFFTRPYFAYENGTDEATYLTYQGALAMQGSLLRWNSSFVTLMLQNLQVSGAQQNLGMDVMTLVILYAGTFYVASRLLAASSLKAAVAAWIVTFGSILFNNANPLIRNVFPNARYEDTFWVSATDGHLSVLRSPEPQLSIIVSMFFVCLAARQRNALWLLLPIPLLYITYLIGYAYLAGVLALCFVITRLTWRGNIIYPTLAANVVTALVGVVAFRLVGTMDMTKDAESLLLSSFKSSFRLAPNFLFSAACVAIALLVNRRSQHIQLWASAAITIVCAQLFLSNQQVLSGVEIYTTGLQNVSGSMISTAALTMLLWALLDVRPQAAINWPFRITSIAASGLVILSIHASQGLDLVNHRYSVLLNHQIDRGWYQRIVADPLSTIVPGEILAGSIAMSSPKMLVPPFGYNYAFPWFANVCPEVPQALEQASDYARLHDGDEVMQRWWPSLEYHVDRSVAAVATAPAGAARSEPCTDRATQDLAIVPLDGDIELWLLRW